MRKTICLLALFAFTVVPNLNAQYECSVNGYVGPDGSSCLYYLNGCYYKVTSHRIFFGLFKWNTEEVVWCGGGNP